MPLSPTRVSRFANDCLEVQPAEQRAGHERKLRVLSIAPALADAVRRIHNGESVSALFDAPGTGPSPDAPQPYRP